MRSLKIIHGALLAGQFLFITFAFIVNKFALLHPQSEELGKALLIIIPLFAVGALLGSKKFFSMRVAVAKTEDNLYGKMKLYREACIIRYALIEAAVLFSIAAFMLTSDLLLLGFGLLMTMVFATARPTNFRIESDLELNSEEKSQLGQFEFRN